MPAQPLRIGELSRRVGVPVELLRAWERRYGLLEPGRTPGGFRLYSEEDVSRVLAMREHVDAGVSAAEAARLVLREDELADVSAQPARLNGALPALTDALARFDEAGAQAVLDRLLASFSLDSVLGQVLLPYLRELGERWERGTSTVAEEHFASNVIRGRLTGLARGWGRGSGPCAVLACAADEQHDLPLLMLGLVLREHGWRIGYLGADTPGESLERVADALSPAAVVVSGSIRAVFDAQLDGLRAIAARFPLSLAGAGASSDLASSLGARYLAGDPVEAGATLAAERG